MEERRKTHGERELGWRDATLPCNAARERTAGVGKRRCTTLTYDIVRKGCVNRGYVQTQDHARGHVHMMSAVGGGGGYPKSRCSKGGCVNLVL